MPAATQIRLADLQASLPDAPLSRRFLAKLQEGPAPLPELGVCLLWTGHITPKGYGQFRAGERVSHAHLWLWQQLNGPVPEGKELHHFCHEAAVNLGTCEGGETCPHRRCVIHVEPVTHRENMLRGNTFQAEEAARTRCTGQYAPPGGHDLTDPKNVYTPPDPNRQNERHCRACNRERVAAFRRRQARLRAQLSRYGEQLTVFD